MKIVHVIASLSIGGAETLLKDLAINFKNKGHDISIVVLMRTESFLPSELEIAGVSIIYAPVSKKISIRNLLFLWNYLRNNKPDIVHAHLTWDTYAAAIVKIFLKHKPVFMATEHSTFGAKRRENFFVKLLDLERWLYDKYCRVVCINNEVFDSINSTVPGIKNKCILIKSGIDIKKFSSEYLIDERLKKPAILNIGTLCNQKQQEILVRSMAGLPQIVELWLIGGGPGRFFLESLVTELNLGDRVRFLGMRSDVEVFIKKATIYVQASLYEGLSIAMLEAMAGGLPMIASDAPGMHELVVGVGELFEAGNWAQLSKMISQLLYSKSDLLKMSRASKMKASDFSIESTAESYLKLYDEEVRKQ